jgi:hypothetical protein
VHDWRVLPDSEKLDILNWKVDKLMSQQDDFTSDVNALATFLTTTLPNALTAIQTALANQGITNLAPLDALVNTDLPAVQSTLNTIVPPASGTSPVTTDALKRA